jgi:hypothetical protein
MSQSTDATRSIQIGDRRVEAILRAAERFHKESSGLSTRDRYSVSRPKILYGWPNLERGG